MTADLNKLDLLSLEDASKVSGYTVDQLLMLAETDTIDLLIFVQYNELFPDIKAWELPYDEPPDSGCYLAIPPNRAGELRRNGQTGTDVFFLPRNQYPYPVLKEFLVSRTSNIPEPGDKISCCNTTILSFGPENTHIHRDSLIQLCPKDKNSNDQQHQQTTGSGQARQQVEKKSFSIPPGTEWYDIRIHFRDLNNVLITIGKKGRKYERTYKSLGFLNKKTKGWQQGWMHLLLMAVYRGNPPNIKEVENLTKKHVSDLGKKLKRLFPGIDGNPFKTYHKEQGWEPRISLSYSKIIEDQYLS